MPWTAADAHKKNHSISSGSKKSRQWSDIANSVLKRTGDEGLAIREASGVVKRKASGGLVPHMADGGLSAMNIEDPARLNPYFMRQQAQGWGSNPFTHGLLNSAVPGRTDQLPTTVASNSHVIPADVISGLGQGSTMSGANVMNHILSTGPWATTNLPLHHGSGPPRAPAPFYNPLHQHAKKGGTTHKPTKIIAAGGEFIISPEQVEAIGAGDINRGHKFLDNFIKKVRVHTAKTMLALPGPKK